MAVGQPAGGGGCPPSPEPAQRPPFGFAVIDLETTGIDARSNRVIECAVIELDPFGNVRSEWSTLVRIPGTSEPGAHFIHGISRSMLERAPSFVEMYGELIVRLRDKVLVGHVLAFDLDHLAAEFARVDLAVPNWHAAGICTRELARRHMPAGRRSLAACCVTAGVPFPDAHSALGDARATAALLRFFLRSGVRVAAPTVRAAERLEWPVVGQCQRAAMPRTALRS